jgi:hypothetical protein
LADKSSLELSLAGIGTQLQTRLLAVPVYQRPYSWGDDEVRDFWNDLRVASQRKPPEYFLGTVVLTREGTKGRDTIIDGQQRLATTTMLLAAIRQEFASRADKTRKDIIHETYITTSDLGSGERVPRLRMSSDDDAFFRKYVVENNVGEKPTRKSHERMQAAFVYLCAQVKGIANSAAGNWVSVLTEFVEFVKSNARCIVLEVPTEADAFLIFETLNDRGADLTIADLLKNYLFGRAGHQLDTTRDGWQQAVGALEIATENATFTMFLRHYWSSKRGAVRERDLYADIKNNVTSENQSVEFVADLQKAARLYAALLNSDHETWSSLGADAKAAIETFLRFDFEQVRPLVLAALQHFQPGEVKNLLVALTNWGVRGVIVGGIGGGTYEKSYCDAAVKIRKGEVKSTADVFAELGKIIPSDEEFQAAFAVARVPKSNLARYYLLALENVKMGQKEPELVPNDNEDKVNLEHVLPKGAAEGDWGKSFTSEERKDWVYRLGNLALLQKGPNGRIGNKPFTAKKPILAASALSLTKDVGAKMDWTPTEIRVRQAELAKLAVLAWPRKP